MPVDPNRLDVTDDEINQVCEGLVQNAAKIRFLQRLGLRVSRKPSGAPLVARAEWIRVFGSAPEQRQAATVHAIGPKWRKAA